MDTRLEWIHAPGHHQTASNDPTFARAERTVLIRDGVEVGFIDRHNDRFRAFGFHPGGRVGLKEYPSLDEARAAVDRHANGDSELTTPFFSSTVRI